MPHKEENTEFTPDTYPPFPEGAEFPTVELQTISLKRLLDRDEAELDRAFEAFKTRGFVYLELAGPEAGETILHGADDICRVAERVFELPVEEKHKYLPKVRTCCESHRASPRYLLITRPSVLQNKELFGYVLIAAPDSISLTDLLLKLQDQRRHDRGQDRHPRHGRVLQREQERYDRA